MVDVFNLERGIGPDPERRQGGARPTFPKTRRGRDVNAHMSAGVDVVNLDLNADSIADPLDAALQDVTNIQFSADLLQIDASAFIGESGVA